jgi:hypothetical protein
MTCQGIQQLLPLHVEGDLPRRKAERVRRHVESCADCRGLADQYRRSQTWLRASAPGQVTGAQLDQLRRAIWRRIEAEPQPAPWWLAIERAWAALRRWSSQPLAAAMAVGLVVLGSVALTRSNGLGGSRVSSLGIEDQGPLESTADDGADLTDDPESLLALATRAELAEGAETGEADLPETAADDAMRIEIQTKDPNVRIIWFAPPAEPAVEN